MSGTRFITKGRGADRQAIPLGGFAHRPKVRYIPEEDIDNVHRRGVDFSDILFIVRRVEDVMDYGVDQIGFDAECIKKNDEMKYPHLKEARERLDKATDILKNNVMPKFRTIGEEILFNGDDSGLGKKIQLARADYYAAMFDLWKGQEVLGKVSKEHHDPYIGHNPSEKISSVMENIEMVANEMNYVISSVERIYLGRRKRDYQIYKLQRRHSDDLDVNVRVRAPSEPDYL